MEKVWEKDIKVLDGENFLNCEEKVNIVQVQETFGKFRTPFRMIIAGIKTKLAYKET